MTNEEYLFRQSQREHSFSGARHKRNGSKSKKCTLPHEHMTAKERKEMNGKVSTYNIRKPMTHKEFKELPDDLKKDYLSWLNATFHANRTHIAEDLLKIRADYFSRAYRDTAVGLLRYGEPLPSWGLFLNGAPLDDDTKDEPREEEADTKTEKAAEETSETGMGDTEVKALHPFRMTSEIVASPEELSAWLGVTLRKDRRYVFRLVAELPEEAT